MDILLTGSSGEFRFTLMKGDEVCDVALWYRGAPDGWGNLYRARVMAKAASFDGFFVQLDHQLSGFLTTKKTLQEGQFVTAQIIRSAQNHKGPRLKLIEAELEEKPGPVGLLQEGPHPLEDLLAQAPEANIYFKDPTLAAQLPAKYRSRLKRLVQDDVSFLDEEWSNLLESTVQVGPLTAHIMTTPALTAIDLDASSTPDFTANIEAFRPVLRQIRLRNLSGTLVIDPAGLRTKKRAALIPFFENILKKENDPLRPKILGLTPSGLIEITRQRQRPPLLEKFLSPYGQGVSILRHILRENLSGTNLHAPASIIKALVSDAELMVSFEKEWGRKLQFTIISPQKACSWSLS